MIESSNISLNEQCATKKVKPAENSKYLVVLEYEGIKQSAMRVKLEKNDFAV